MARSQTGSLGGTNHGLRIEYSTPAMDYRTQTRTEAHPKIRPYARSVRKTGLGVDCAADARFLWHQSSCWPQGEPYAVSRSRKGTESNASGPSTPLPVHVPFARSSSATTGLIAVCHTTHWWPYSAIDHWLSTTW